MNIGIDGIGFTSLLSNRIVVNTDDGYPIQMVVKMNSIKIYESTLYPLDGRVIFYDLVIIVQEYMRNNLLSSGELSVSAVFPHIIPFSERAIEPYAETVTAFVVYSSIRTSYEDDMEFLLSHFLTTRSCYTIPRGKSQMFSFFEKGGVDPSGYIDVSFMLADGSVSTTRLTNRISMSSNNKIYNFGIDSNTLDTRVKSLYPNNSPKVLGGTIVHESRVIDFFFTDDEPLESFGFYNAFNVWENYHVYGVSNIKTSFTQKEAICAGVSSYYNQSASRVVEIKTVPLSYEEALWVNELLGSKRIVKVIPPDDERDILISDVTSEISDSDKETISIKFSWKYADPFVWKIYH